MSAPEREKSRYRPISRQAGVDGFSSDSRESSGVRDCRGDFLPRNSARRFGSIPPQHCAASYLVRRASLTFLTEQPFGVPLEVGCKDCAGRSDSALYAKPNSIGPAHACRTVETRPSYRRRASSAKNGATRGIHRPDVDHRIPVNARIARIRRADVLGPPRLSACRCLDFRDLAKRLTNSTNDKTTSQHYPA